MPSPNFGVLDVYTRVARPRSLENGVAATVLPGLAEVGLAQLLQIIEAHICWLTTHLFQQLFSV